MKEIIIGPMEAGQRFDKWLSKYFNTAPKSFYYKMLRNKNITLNGKKAEGSEKLTEGDAVKLFLSEETIASFREEVNQVLPIIKLEDAKELSILYEDFHVLIINKPIGMLSQKAKNDDISLVEYVISYLLSTGSLKKEELATFKPSVCNRLDRNTSGIVVAGKSLIGLQEMSLLFKTRALHKYYRCIVKGTITKEGYLKGYLRKDHKTNQVTVKKQAEPYNGEDSYIETKYQPIRNGSNYTELEVLLITGKTHQIRAHLSSIGHPIIGDFKYGDKELNVRLNQKYGLSHQLLHSYRLEFPTLSNEVMNLSEKTIIAPVPVLFETLRKELLN